MSRIEQEVEAALAADSAMPAPTDALLATVVRRARQRRRARVVGSAVAVAMVTAGVLVVPAVLPRDRTALPADPAPATSSVTFTGNCTVTALPLPPDIAALDRDIAANVLPSDMDPTGRYVVASNPGTEAEPTAIVIRWDNGVPSRLPVSGFYSSATGVNRHGTVVGMYIGGISLDGGDPATLPGHAWIYENGAVTELPTPPGYDAASAMTINERGEVAGVAVKVGAPTAAVVWSADAARTPRVLTAPGGAGAYGIADDGSVVGYAGDPGDGVPQEIAGRPYAWAPDGTGRFLAVPDGEQVGEVRRIRGDWAMGSVGHAVHIPGKGTQPVMAPVLWNLRTGDMSMVDGMAAVNAHGAVAHGSTGPAQPGSLLVRDGTSYPLVPLRPTDPDHPTAWTTPVAISDDATTVLGRSVTLLGPPTPVIIWRC